jgi:hypothetical protein
MRIKQEDWKHAALDSGNLSELELTLGEVAVALGDAEQSVTYADRSGDAFQRIARRTVPADVLNQAGCGAEAETRFREAEQVQAKAQPAYPLLYSLPGFRYCDLLLAVAERVAWQIMLEINTQNLTLGSSIESCRAVSHRAAKTLKWVSGRDILSQSLDHLTLGRAALYEAILTNSKLETPNSELVQAVADLRRSGNMDELPRGLLTRAWLRILSGAHTGSEGAQEDLDEAWEIAERGPMKLHMADIHLYRARLFALPNADCQLPIEEQTYPWNKNPDGSPRGPLDDLAAAERLINQCGYHRRDEELADAKEAAKSW